MAIYKSLVHKISIHPDKKTKQKDYQKYGKLPIIDQGQLLIGGYSNDLENRLICSLPVIVFGDHTRIVKYVNFPFGAGADGIKVLEPKESVLPKYLYYGTQYLVLKLRDRGYARHYQFIEKMDLPISSFLEQERIVSRIEELFSQLDASVAELKTAKERLKVYRQAVLKEAFSKYHTFTSLEQISERIFDGPFGSNLKTADYVEQGVRVVRLENLKNAWFDDTKRSFVTREKYQTISNHTVYPDDLIMSTFISEDIKICQLPKDVRFAVNKADCIGIRLKSGVNPHFVMFYLSSRGAYNSLIHQVHGATRPRVNTKQIKAMQIPVAELCEQDATVTEIEEEMSICDSIEKTVDTTLQQAEALRQSILKKAFGGKDIT